MREYIEKQCGVFLPTGNEHLIETYLSALVLESGSKSFSEFHEKAINDEQDKIRDRVINAMVTNQTSWFRDEATWQYLREVSIPLMLEEASRGKEVHVWSSAVSTGEEAYSLAILIDMETIEQGNPSLARSINIIATDISSSSLFCAISGRYDNITIDRGLPSQLKNLYFKQEGRMWVLDEKIRKRVTFRRHNIFNPLKYPSDFDLILCRYVATFLTLSYKRKLFSRLAKALKPNGILLVGTSESVRGLSDKFDFDIYKNCIINLRKP